MDMQKNLHGNHSKHGKEGQVIQNLPDAKVSSPEEQTIESWGWSNNTETVRDR
ncbi:hypothetical protein HP567_016665 [Brevibacillus sp. M2.1A]|uniref:hypothetical protein n=1 Tax=Brevibacillus TaxID=55080 RepID=UPI00156B8CD9|nr:MULTISPECIES: hypothetical protein [Brevibacillus]MBY0084279.1 hypothetical protein [Brevibacillus brevis]MCC8436176.1 hypothetical protein [Brevibacillus sp. M2.1A]MCE0449377.1 hypothetical protein [Brevibacillus sp. AF8]